MCYPVLIPIAMAAVSLAGAAVSAAGQAKQAAAANAQAEYQSKIASNNAQIAEMEAQYAEQQGERNAESQRRKTAVMVGAQRAAMGKSGAVADTGSFLDLTLDTVRSGELDALALREEGDLAAWRARAQGMNARAQGQMYSMSKTNPALGIAGTLISGAGQAGSAFFSMSKSIGTQSNISPTNSTRIGAPQRILDNY